MLVQHQHSTRVPRLWTVLHARSHYTPPTENIIFLSQAAQSHTRFSFTLERRDVRMGASRPSALVVVAVPPSKTRTTMSRQNRHNTVPDAAFAAAEQQHTHHTNPCSKSKTSNKYRDPATTAETIPYTLKAQLRDANDDNGGSSSNTRRLVATGDDDGGGSSGGGVGAGDDNA